MAACDALLAAGRVVVLQAPLVAAKALLDALGGAVEALMGILRMSVGLEHHAGIEMDGAIGLESGAFPLERDVAGKPAVEIFPHSVADPRFDVAAKGIAHVEILARNAQTHGCFEPFRSAYRDRPGGLRPENPGHGSASLGTTADLANNALAGHLVQCWAHLLRRVGGQVNRGRKPLPRLDICRLEASAGRGSGACLLVPAALHRRGDAHRFAILGDRAPGDVDAVVAQHARRSRRRTARRRPLVLDQLPDAVAHRFGRMRLAAARRRRSRR